MAELKPGVIGTISGKIDNVVASSWRAIKYLRGLAKTSRKDPSQLQVAQRAAFALTYNFLSQLEDEVNLGFGNMDTSRATAFNLAMGVNVKAVGGTYPDLVFNFPSVVLSKGGLIRSKNARLISAAPAIISVTWGDMKKVKAQSLSDKVTLVAYDPMDDLAVASSGEAVRGDYKFEFEVPESFSGHDVHVYLFFTRQDNKKNSHSDYCGTVTVF